MVLAKHHIVTAVAVQITHRHVAGPETYEPRAPGFVVSTLISPVDPGALPLLVRFATGQH